MIPSPSTSVWEIPLPLGAIGIESLPLRAYALCIIAGIVAACWITEARLRSRGAPKGTVLDLAVWAVPAGIIGGRIYHVITSPDAYFGEGGDPIAALYIWNGGLGIPGAVALGGAGVWIACRRTRVPFSMIADSIAPALPVAQAIGRLGNWFNQELYGKPTSQPWGLEISPLHQTSIPSEFRGAQAYEPTFLYELVWNLGIAGVIWKLDQRFKFGMGRAFAVYVGLYGLGRFWIEGRRIDVAHAFLGLRVNEWVALAMMVGAVIYLLRVQGKRLILVTDSAGLLQPVEWDSPQAQGFDMADSGRDVEDSEKTEEPDTDSDSGKKTRPGERGSRGDSDDDDSAESTSKEEPSGEGSGS